MRLRSSAATKMNDRSSRSHAILTFYIESRPAASETAPVTMGKLHLVDLAGSERLVRSVVEGQNKKEAQQINASLTALGTLAHTTRHDTTHNSGQCSLCCVAQVMCWRC
jgi:hypothetical protein